LQKVRQTGVAQKVVEQPRLALISFEINNFSDRELPV
jgi:hypothetical protein